MPTYAWQPIVTRWGDAVFRIALLLGDDRESAEQHTIETFAIVLATPPDDVETALYAELLKRRQRSGRFGGRRELPRSLRRIPPRDRALLALWLLLGIDGRRLAAISRLDPDALVAVLVGALRRLTDSARQAARESTGDDSWTRFVAADLGLRPVTPLEAEYGRAVDTVRVALRSAIGRASLPRHCYESIDEAIIRRRESLQTPWWQRPHSALGLLLGGIALLLIVVIAPWQQGPQPSVAATIDARDVVEQVLNQWSTPPTTGTLHRRVLARDTMRTGRDAQPVQTDVWIEAESPRHRIETRRGSALVEWQMGDGERLLWYAAEPGQAACRWPDLPMLPPRAARNFEATPSQQAEALEARLTLGAYGEGYRALRRALDAPDLRSFGTRLEDGALLLMLGYTDRRSEPARQVLLWIDTTEHELRAVQEVVQAGGQSAARDIWRLKQREALTIGMPRARPEWARIARQRAAVIDPACLQLQQEYIVSLRMAVGATGFWNVPWLPSSPPPGISEAILISSSPQINQLSGFLPGSHAIFRGPDRWLNLTLGGSGINWSDGERHGDWLVTLSNEDGRLSGMLCHQPSGINFCASAIPFAGYGWTEDELLQFVDTLVPIDAQTWLALDDLFFDPTPRDQTTEMLLRTAAASSRIEDGWHYIRTRRTQLVPVGQPQGDDPYQLPPELIRPPQMIDELWLEVRDGRVSRFNQQQRLPDGTLRATDRSDGSQYFTYSATEGIARLTPRIEQLMPWDAPPQPPATAMLVQALIAPGALSARAQPEGWVVEYELPSPQITDHPWMSYFGLNRWPGEQLLPGRYVARIAIDRATNLPHRAEAIIIDPSGSRQTISSIEIEEQRRLTTAPDPATFEMPPLPAETFLVEEWGSRLPWLQSPAEALQAPGRFLVWPDDYARRLRDRNPRLTQLARPEIVLQALYSGLQGLDGTGLIKTTFYELPSPAGQLAVTVRQGNATLLRHILRHNPGLPATPSGRASRPIPVAINGAQRTAWLIEGLGQPMLIIEVDDLLLHITSRNADELATVVAPALANMVWNP